jgi:hypothetical protein
MAEIVKMLDEEKVAKIKKEQDNKKLHATFKRRQRFLQRQRNHFNHQPRLK